MTTTPQKLLLGSEAVSEVKLHPLVVFQILDRAQRRGEDQARVIGSLLGRVENGVCEITNSFAVPHLESADEVAVGKDFHTQMYELHQRVNEGEMLVGWYATTSGSKPALVDEHASLIHQFYSSVCEQPVHLVVDARLAQDALQVAAFLSSPLEAVDADMSPANQFKQIPVAQKVSEPAAIALNAMLPAEVEDADKAAALPNELAALEQSIEQLYECLERAGAHSRAVVAGKAPADAKLGREMADALASIPMIRAEQFDQLFSGGLQDLLMVSYLSGLTQAQLSMAEKLINT